MSLTSGELTNKQKSRIIFADWTRQKEAAKLGLRTPLRIEAFNGGTNPALAYQQAVEGAAYTSRLEELTYIAEVNPVPINPVIVPPESALWATSIKGTSNAGNSIVLDSLGNIYVCGYFTGTATIMNYSSAPVNNGQIGLSTYGTITGTIWSDGYIVKYNSSGVVEWATTIVNSGGRGVRCVSLAINSNNDLYVTGYYSGTTSINNFSSVSGEVVNLNLFGTLPVTSISQRNIFVAKYNSSGSALWATAINGTGSLDQGYAINLDSNGNVYISGLITGTVTIKNYSSVSGGVINVATFATITTAGSYDAGIIKYNSSGVAQWATTIGGTSSDYSTTIAIDRNNFIYVSGLASGSITIKSFSSISGGAVVMTTFGTMTATLFLVKYNSDGVAQWATRMSGGNGLGYGLAIDSLNNIYVTGYIGSTATIYDYDSVSGGVVNTIAYGTISALAGNDGIIILKYNSDGKTQWATKIDGSGSDTGYAISCDSNDNIYVTGNITGPSTIYNYSSAPVAGGTVGLTEYAILTGAGNYDIPIIKYNSQGIAQWATTIGGSGLDIGYSIVSDTSNNIYVTGYYRTTTTINNFRDVTSGTVNKDPYGTLIASGANIEMYLVKISQSS
jgi:hypothetical protein